MSFEPSDLSFEPSGPSFEPFASEYYVLHGNAYCMFAWKTSGARRRAFFAVGLEQLTNCSSPASYLPVNSVLHHAAWRDVRAAAMNPEPDPVFLQIIDARQLVGGEPGARLSVLVQKLLRNLALSSTWAHRRHRMVDQEIFEHRAAEGPADERCHHRLSQDWEPLSPNRMCEKLWTLPQSVAVLQSPSGCQSERLTPRPPEKLLSSYGVAGETVRGASR